MKQVLVCRSCETMLSCEVSVLEEGIDARFPKLTWGDQLPLSEKGVALKRNEPYQRTVSGDKSHLEFTPCYLMRLDDLKKKVALTSDSRRLNGCCGLDGCDGPNRICICGNFVGTEQSDCWTPKVFIPDNEKTKWKNVKS